MFLWFYGFRRKTFIFLSLSLQLLLHLYSTFRFRFLILKMFRFIKYTNFQLCPLSNRKSITSFVFECAQVLWTNHRLRHRHQAAQRAQFFFFVIVNVDLMWGTYLSQTWYHCSGWSSFETIGIGNAVMSAMAHTPPIKYIACLRRPMPHETREKKKNEKRE